MENAGNQNTGKPLDSQWYYIQTSHHVINVCLIVLATVLSLACYKIIVVSYYMHSRWMIGVLRWEYVNTIVTFKICIYLRENSNSKSTFLMFR